MQRLWIDNLGTTRDYIKMNHLKANILLDKVLENLDNPDKALSYLEQSLFVILGTKHPCIYLEYWAYWDRVMDELKRSISYEMP